MVQSLNSINVTEEIFKPWISSHRPAVYYKDEVWSYQRLYEEINKVGNALLKLGIGRGQRIIMISYDTPYFFSVFYGAMKIGTVPIPLNTYLRESEYSFYIEDSGATLVVVEPDIWEKIRKYIPENVKVMALPGEIEDRRVVRYHDIIDEQSKDLKPVKTFADETAFILYTSGTTGYPRGAVHLHKDMLVCNANYARNVLKVNEKDKFYSASKQFFAYGLGASYFAFANGGSIVVTPEKVNAELILKTIDKYRPTIFFGVPTIFNMILNYAEWQKYRLDSLKFCVSAGEPLPSSIYLKWKERYNIEILDGLGSTEALHIYISNYPNESMPGVSGKVVPGYEVRIVDSEGKPVKQGEIGEILLKGDSVSIYYLNRYYETKRKMLGEWFRTGDLAYVDDKGYYHYVGRADDTMKVSGLWVSPIEVESVLMKHPAVYEAAVVGVPDEVGLTRVVGFVVLKSDFKPSEEMAKELLEFVKIELPTYKCPKEIRFVDEIPKTATGKLQRFKLRLVLQQERNKGK